MVPRRLVSLVRSPYLSDLLCRGTRVPEAQVVDESVDVGAPYPREQELSCLKNAEIVALRTA